MIIQSYIYYFENVVKLAQRDRPAAAVRCLSSWHTFNECTPGITCMPSSDLSISLEHRTYKYVLNSFFKVQRSLTIIQILNPDFFELISSEIKEKCVTCYLFVSRHLWDCFRSFYCYWWVHNRQKIKWSQSSSESVTMEMENTKSALIWDMAYPGK